jgi:hypothetical protein
MAARGARGASSALCRAASLALYVCASYATFKASARLEDLGPRREAAALWAHLGLLRCVAGLTRSRGLEALGAALLVGGYLSGRPAPALADIVFARAETLLAAAHVRCAAQARQWLLSALGAQTRHMDVELLAELHAVLLTAKADVERVQEERLALKLVPPRCVAASELAATEQEQQHFLLHQSLPRQPFREEGAGESPRHGTGATARMTEHKRTTKSVVFAENVRYVEPDPASAADEQADAEAYSALHGGPRGGAGLTYHVLLTLAAAPVCLSPPSASHAQTSTPQRAQPRSSVAGGASSGAGGGGGGGGLAGRRRRLLPRVVESCAVLLEQSCSSGGGGWFGCRAARPGGCRLPPGGLAAVAGAMLGGLCARRAAPAARAARRGLSAAAAPPAAGSKKKELTPEEQAKALEAHKALEARRLQYNAEVAAYEEQMSALRKQYAKEHAELVKREELDRQARVARGIEREALLKQKRAEFMAKIDAQRTSLEIPVQELIKESPEQRRARIEASRKQKAVVRQQVLEKLQWQAKVNESRAQMETAYLAREAHDWLVPEDLADAQALDDKIKSKLIKIQPMTAAWANEVPKHHYVEAHKWLTDDTAFNPNDFFNADEMEAAKARGEA